MSGRRGFTLLEVLVATVIMGIAVVGVLSTISGAMRNAARLTDYDRAALLARDRMNELIAAPRLPWNTVLSGAYDSEMMGGFEGGWQARVTPFLAPPAIAAGLPMMDRIELQIWWQAGDNRRTYSLDGYRTHRITPDQAAQLSSRGAP